MRPHPEIAHLTFLLGTWHGRGEGDYPTIEPFSYQETVVFGHGGKPFISYSQRTRGDDGPLHSETGYVRPAPNGAAELVVAQPTGIVEIHEGTVESEVVRFESRQVIHTPTAKAVSRVSRTIAVAGDVLTNELWMEAVGQDHQWHLRASLHRVE